MNERYRRFSVRRRSLALGACVALTACGGRAAPHVPGRQQAASFQTALKACLGKRGISYTPVLEQPGAVQTLVPAPPPYEWWAAHGGFGLIDDQAAEVPLDLGWRDPNLSLIDGGGRHDLEQILYGPGGTPDQFAAGACFDRALRTAGFFQESQAGSLRAPVREELDRVAAHKLVKAAGVRRTTCLLEAALTDEMAADPETVLRDRFRADGLITSDGVHAPGATADDLRRARQTEEKVARMEIRCNRRVGLDRTVDAVLRRILKEGTR